MHICPFSKSKFNLYEAKSLTVSTLLHRLVLSIELSTVQTGTGKVYPVRKFKRTTTARDPTVLIPLYFHTLKVQILLTATVDVIFNWPTIDRVAFRFTTVPLKVLSDEDNHDFLFNKLSIFKCLGVSYPMYFCVLS